MNTNQPTSNTNMIDTALRCEIDKNNPKSVIISMDGISSSTFAFSTEKDAKEADRLATALVQIFEFIHKYATIGKLEIKQVNSENEIVAN